MAIESKNKRTIIFVAAFATAVSVLATWWVLQQPQGSGQPVEATSGDVGLETAPSQLGDVAEAGQVTDEKADQEQEQSGEPPPNRRKVSEPPKEPGKQTLVVTGENIAEVASTALESALEGDLSSGYILTRLREGCSIMPHDEAELEEQILKATERANDLSRAGYSLAAEGITVHRILGISTTQFPTESENRIHLTQWYWGCSQLRKLFSSDLRVLLETMAQAGHVMARYLYATWRPSLRIENEVLVTAFDWQLKAFDFSYANLEEGEAAGLLAFGQSYFSTLFTFPEPALGIALIKAALDCGVESDGLSWLVNRFTGDYGFGRGSLMVNSGATIEDVLALADELSEQCRN